MTNEDRAKCVIDALRGFEVGDIVRIAVLPSSPAGRILNKLGRRLLVKIPRNTVIHDVAEEDLVHAD